MLPIFVRKTYYFVWSKGCAAIVSVGCIRVVRGLDSLKHTAIHTAAPLYLVFCQRITVGVNCQRDMTYPSQNGSLVLGLELIFSLL